MLHPWRNDEMNTKDTKYRDKLMQLSLRIVRLKNYLNEQKHEYSIADQILRSGTSIGANHREATYAESDSDFIHNTGLYQEAEEIMKMLTISILTTRKRINNHH